MVVVANEGSVERGITTRSDFEIWDELLRAFAEVLDDQRAVLLGVDADAVFDDSVVAPPAFMPPAGAPPMPYELRSRAASLQRETDGLLELARELLGRLEPTIAAAPTPMRRLLSTNAVSSLMDTRL